MALSDLVTARLSSIRLVQLTNPDAQSPTTVDSTRLTAACNDAEGEFEVYCGKAFDVTDFRHIAPIVDLVVVILKERGGAATEGLSGEREKVIQRIKDLALVTGRNRIMPEAASYTSETFSDRVFEQTTLDPQGGEDDDE